MPKNDFIKLTLPNDLSYLPLAQNCVRQAAEKFGFENRELGQIELALEEAVTNVIKHAYDTAENNTFDITATRTALGTRIIIKDRGMPFDAGVLPEYNPFTVASDNMPGLGVFLMKNAVDQYSLVNLGADGKETHLVKNLPQKNIEEHFKGQKLEEDATPTAPKILKEKIPYEVRRMRPDEAIEVSRCAYKSHGYTFFDSTIYYPERIVELNNSDELISVVAVTKDNIFMGHTALHYPHVGAKIAELTFAFVNMEYRGQGCLSRMTDLLFTMEKRYPLAGIYINSVTNHLFTQKVAQKYACNDCGIYLAASPGTWIFKGISDESKQRLSVALSFKYLQPPQKLTLFPPKEHRPMLEKLYKNIGADHVYKEPDGAQASLADEKSVLRTDIYASENCAEIWVNSFGKDLRREIKNILHDLCVKQVSAIYLYMDLSKPQTYFETPELQKLGFFFSGILPQTDIGDTLVLQYLNNVALDYSQIQILTEPAKELLAYIKAKDPHSAVCE